MARAKVSPSMPRPPRVTKRTAAKTAPRFSTKQLSNFAAESLTSCAAGPRMSEEVACEEEGLQELVVQEEADEGRQIQASSKGKERAHDNPDEIADPSPEERPFPLMELPAEIRNEIYRACLTRPFNILLSKQEAAFSRPAAEETPKIDASSGPMNGARLTELLDTMRTDRRGSNTRAGRQPARLLREDLAEIVAPSSGRTLRPRLASGRTIPTTRAVTSNLSGLRANSSSSLTPASRPTNWRVVTHSPQPEIRRKRRPQDDDPLVVDILRLNKQVYDEARSILYSENHFTLDLDTATSTLAALHQRSRRQIKHVELEIPCYNEILERFQETVRLSLRYCWGLRTFVIHMPFTLPGADGSNTTGNTTVYANGFDILRWLPRQCEVQLKGRICQEISAVVSKNANLAKSLDELAYARRQLISNETERTAPSRFFS